jgi:hypothetical protein
MSCKGSAYGCVRAGDYRLLYEQCKRAMDARSANLKQKIAAAYELETMKKDSRKAKVTEGCICMPTSVLPHSGMPVVLLSDAWLRVCV